MDEFELIDAMVDVLGSAAEGPGVAIGPGDDAAVLGLPAGHQLVVSTDTLVAGRHFPADAEADVVGHPARVRPSPTGRRRTGVSPRGDVRVARPARRAGPSHDRRLGGTGQGAQCGRQLPPHQPRPLPRRAEGRIRRSLAWDEFELIDAMVAVLGNAAASPGVAIGAGDEAAVLDLPAGHQLVVCTDTLVAGRHFPADAEADVIGYRTMAVATSDLAAMGATSAYATVSLTIEHLPECWAKRYAAGIAAAAGDSGLAMVRGGVARGPAQLGGVERATLRTGACELRDRLDAPVRVVIDDWGELAKGFRATDSFRYIKGVLDRVARDARRAEYAER